MRNVGETIAMATDAGGNYATVRQTHACNSHWHGQVKLTFFSQWGSGSGISGKACLRST